MDELPLVVATAFTPPPHLLVMASFGRVGKGASNPLSLGVTDGRKFLAKGPMLCRDYHFIAANEYVAAGLARCLGLPVQDYAVLEWNGQLFFGSAWLDDGTYQLNLDSQLLSECVNRHRVYDLVVFDAWICNWDRHENNLLVRMPRKGKHGKELIFNDHSHCLIPQGGSVFNLRASHDSHKLSKYIHIQPVIDAITESSRLSAALDRSMLLDRCVVEQVVSSIPEALLPIDHQDRLAQFLLSRRAELRSRFCDERAIFPNLDRGTI